MRITNIQKKELSIIAKRSGLNLFDFETIGEYHEFKIKFKHDYFSFNIVKVKDDIYSLSILAIDRKNPYNYSDNWGNTLTKFENWSKRISDELNSPTGWETFENVNFMNAEFEDLNLEFTESEKIQTKQNIDVLKSKIKLLQLPDEKLNIIEHKLDLLSLKVDELNKFDWKSLFIGTIASLIMSLIIPPDTSGIIWEYIKSSFSNLKING
jgi:hypothetical protein